MVIDKNDRMYIGQWFKDGPPREGDVIVFEMPPFCSGDYSAKVHADSDGDLYIAKSDDWSKGCVGSFIFPREKVLPK